MSDQLSADCQAAMVLTLDQAYEQILGHVNRHRYFLNQDALAVTREEWITTGLQYGWTAFTLGDQLAAIRLVHAATRAYELSLTTYQPEHITACGEYAQWFFRAAAILFRAPANAVTELPETVEQQTTVADFYVIDGVTVDQKWCTMKLASL